MVAFDALAGDYDATFSHTVLGRLLRGRVHARLEAGLAPGGRVLEVNCGTGVDAVWLARRGHRVLATDASPAMVAHTRRAVVAAGVAERVHVEPADLDHLERLHGTPAQEALAPFDAVLSNFGGLNCAADLDAVLGALAGLVRPGGRAWLCIMGPMVPWEWAWFAVQGDWTRARRRLRRHPTWRGLALQYPSVRRARSAARAAGWEPRRVDALAALTPPPFAESLAVRRPGVVRVLDRWERRFATAAPLVWTADHYLLELERR